ncbi:hypothetical protein L1887_19812 [Cichorium endivia]|nr:hypothetical protein L1887_19812 [Cichorium endivia]
MKWTGLTMKWARFPNHIDTQQQKRKRVWLNASPSLDHHTSVEKGLAAIIPSLPNLSHSKRFLHRGRFRKSAHSLYHICFYRSRILS